jgi:hypothetical protein
MWEIWATAFGRTLTLLPSGRSYVRDIDFGSIAMTRTVVASLKVTIWFDIEVSKGGKYVFMSCLGELSIIM